MRLPHLFACGVALAMLGYVTVGADGQDAAKAVAGGGISVPGWMGKIDPQEEKAGQVLNNAKLAQEGKALRVTTGPAVTYWNPANMASGNYTVKATFTESQYMGLNDHAHPYGIVIAGTGMGTPDQSYVYCATYGDGRFIVRGFSGAATFRMNGGKGEVAGSVNKAAGKGQPVTQEIAMSVTPDAVTCSVNGTVVGKYPKADIVAAGKLKSTDGVYGIRFAHNTDATVTGLTMTKN
jgi:hypothetical protein